MSTEKTTRLSERERALLEAAAEYGLSDVGGEYYRLGGHGRVRVRYNWSTLPSMQRRGLMIRDGYWKATDVGKAVLKELANG